MNNDKKICFISCVNDDRQYEECVKYINNLIIPDGYSIEVISIKEANSITEGYNGAMNSTDAKYKVYLHQDVFIINKNFIQDILDIFENHEQVGMVGVTGAKTIPTSGIWWDSVHKYGKVYESHIGNMELMAFNECTSDIENVKAIDGLIIITQYDINWREDLFDGWHFYDLSQSTEFKLAGYEIAIPKQNIPWCIHDCGIVNTKNGYEKYRNVFLEEYSKKIFPLVSIVILTHNRPHYFKIALESAINQTYKNIEIIVCDDSDDDETKQLVSNYLKKHDNIKYYYEKGISGIENQNNGLRIASGEYLGILMDDDIYHVDKINRMVNYFIEFEDISIVTSHRQVIDEDGNILPDIPATQRIFNKDTIIDGIALGNYVLTNMVNCIGEPTTILTRREHIKENEYYLGGNHEYKPNGDIARNLRALAKGRCAYISDSLSYFRIHEGQGQNNPEILKWGIIDWFYLIKTSYDKNLFFRDEIDYRNTLIKWCNLLILHIGIFNSEKLDYHNELIESINYAIKFIISS